MTVNAHRVVGVAAPFVLALAALAVPAQAAAGSHQGGQVHETSCTSPGKKLICDKRWTRLR
ncbi:hypothetical protein GKQ77_03645 [Streptomyces sp. BG9H]|uniref:Uncharacterized protein n=1 Tax=Streptomyces anatolicus TaxID=2675858 RepID=A0ABS6YGX3_9ACTN|nr:hypothetical protein [Streptomyces anatolicus]MBW5420664.1 hypothetical protein [Streptomyces anatolicus]